MANFAPAEHLSYYRSSTGEPLARLARPIRSWFQRWAAAHHQKVQDRMFWELALTDPRVMGELQAIRDRAQIGK